MRASARERMLCTFCQARIPIKAFCPECGNPTAHASRDERIQFELEKWGRTKEGAASAPRARRPAQEEPDRVIDLAALERPTPAPRRRRAESARRSPQPARHEESAPRPPARAPATEPPAVARLHTPTDKHELRWRHALNILPDEIVGFSKEGRCGPERATLVITKYRVAVVQGARARWIPLESIDDIAIVESGSNARLVVSGSIEKLSFRHPDRTLLDAVLQVLRHERTLAQMPGGLRHHPEVMQQWVEGISNTWKSPFRSVLLWLHRHPAAAAIFH